MRAYVDSSCLLAMAFSEADGPAMAERLALFSGLLSSHLLEAEVRAAFRRVERSLDGSLLEKLIWVAPQRPLTEQIERVLATGYLRGADTWHIACALYATDSPNDLAFLTLDKDQRDVAAQLGFPT